MKEGFIIGGGLIFAGLILKLSVGPVVWEAFAWPVNGIVLAGFLALITCPLPKAPAYILIVHDNLKKRTKLICL